jgi:hypothetical protein
MFINITVMDPSESLASSSNKRRDIIKKEKPKDVKRVKKEENNQKEKEIKHEEKEIKHEEKEIKHEEKQIKQEEKDHQQPDIEDIANNNNYLLHNNNYHNFNTKEITSIREGLLKWYDNNKRELPWRKMNNMNADEDERNRRAYEVWVSEIMLQQTRYSSSLKSQHTQYNKTYATQHNIHNTIIIQYNMQYAQYNSHNVHNMQ